MTIHSATVSDQDGAFYFASLDGQRYVGVDREPVPGDRRQIERRLNTGNAKSATVDERSLRIWGGADFKTVEESE